MRVAAFAITLMLGGAAIAQTTTTTTTDQSTGMSTGVSTQVGTTGVEADVDVNAQATTSMPSTSTTTTTQSNTSWNTGQTTMASNMTGQTVQPSNANPERDARGIRVISDPAVAPAGYNGTAGTGMGGPVADTSAMGSDSSAPACSKTVTDNCVQTYERGRSPR
ncbi:hypothetical protein E2493_16170 [Sphingomonas parva]|uniref:Uncharacterized protein n=1 Tax=Sphingomonas parva TaxID=2555898 RepID=A0A4Y8ZQY9_9SPHN|nr:hypothetical protein [Sphingomonas parva]TFI57239.1 hypothetical protein E2493_16170 [Sphingomonas parva]